MKTTVGTGEWQQDIALVGLTRITETKGEYALVTMGPKGVLRALETTYRDKKVAVGQATRIENASGEACTRVYVVTRFNQKAVVYLDTNTLLWHGDIKECGPGCGTMVGRQKTPMYCSEACCDAGRPLNARVA